MTKEEYKIYWSNYVESTAAIEKQYKAITSQYIEDNRKFQSGDIVKIIFDPRYQIEPVTCFVKNAYNMGEKIEYRFIKMKKDGKPSYNDYYPGYRDYEIQLLSTEWRNKKWDGTPIENNTETEVK